MTPDGFADGPYAIIDAEFYEFAHGLLSHTRTIAFGRNTFEQFQARWPAILEKDNAPEWQLKMARALNDKHKSVYSSTLKTTTWNNSTIIRQMNAKHVNTYKQEGEGGLLTFGSLELVSTLIAVNAIDDYYFCMQPLIAGHGNVRLFDKLMDERRPLQYVDSTSLISGVQIIHYQSVR